MGASGVLGQAVLSALAEHEIIGASRAGQHKVDLREPDSIAALYAGVGKVDAVACAAGVTPFKPFRDLALADYRSGIDDKLLGQIELVRQGVKHVVDGGSFTLISGILVAEAIETGTVAAAVNGGVEAFRAWRQRPGCREDNASTRSVPLLSLKPGTITPRTSPALFQCQLGTKRGARTPSRSAVCRPDRSIGSGTDEPFRSETYAPEG